MEGYFSEGVEYEEICYKQGKLFTSHIFLNPREGVETHEVPYHMGDSSVNKVTIEPVHDSRTTWEGLYEGSKV